MLEIILGYGDKIVSNIHDDESGEWVGIAISDGDCPVGEFTEIEAKTVNELNPLMVIKTANMASLDVIISACERAKSMFRGVK